MNARESIIQKQINWAANRGIKLVGSQGHRGRPTYAEALNDNLFVPLSAASIAEIRAGDGGELLGLDGSVPKMHALHSSSALGVNIFEYWRQEDLAHLIAAECGLCRRGAASGAKIHYEQKYMISAQFRKCPNIDVVIANPEGAEIPIFGIECKFSEAYSPPRDKAQKGLKRPYLELTDAWKEIPSLHALAKTICPEDNTHIYLHAAQLIKHILGLRNEYGRKGFRLLYLWYDALGEAGATHRAEIVAFAARARADGIRFHSISHQELIGRIAGTLRQAHPDYVSYLTARYL